MKLIQFNRYTSIFPITLALMGLHGCSPKNLEECLSDASKAPTERGVTLAASACHQKFSSAADSENVKSPTVESVKVREVCHVFWDGARWKKGEGGNGFTTYSREYYGVEVVHFSIPNAMKESFGSSAKMGERDQNSNLREFVARYWYQVDKLCDLQ
jgi:hypothetical protein